MTYFKTLFLCLLLSMTTCYITQSMGLFTPSYARQIPFETLSQISHNEETIADDADPADLAEQYPTLQAVQADATYEPTHPRIHGNTAVMKINRIQLPDGTREKRTLIYEYKPNGQIYRFSQDRYTIHEPQTSQRPTISNKRSLHSRFLRYGFGIIIATYLGVKLYKRLSAHKKQQNQAQ